MTTKRIAGRILQRRRAVVLATYGPVCHLCGDDVRLDVGPNHPAAFQVDHLIPLYRGGTDDITNWRVSHRLCNLRKGKGPTRRPSRQW
ncbi:MAG TPA: HNH endonuclease signature motif containing protein [Acidimicrobiales bacterium]|nr:HNH endonuclease signature motif containing protein [Acidimicrobiales bacterium]